jgi:hypothetical protein
MPREKERTLERWTVYLRIHFCIQYITGIEFSFVLGFFDAFAGL